MGSVKTCLNEILALWLGNERLELGGSKSIDKTGF